MEKPERSAATFWFDKEFLDGLKEDPKRALHKLGIEPTPKMLDAIQEMDLAPLYTLADAFPGAIKPEEEPGVGAPGEVALVFP